ncbi:hypothetical protein OESDEN_06758 [Oesophagostomum dentatum]|uniref:Uncharacterized protein n=1 Tax=Oesophagostomum dentatum TaxID=61180 RepID=A0A0B1T7V5_OESDE|nr:hypothetical protein OESDEN_06758 [Oesophagostomum dentatum]
MVVNFINLCRKRAKDRDCYDVGSLLKTQMQSLISNRTTIEDSQLSFIDEDELDQEFPIFDLGSSLDNFCSVFGKFPATWFMPVYTTPGDGVNYPFVIRCGREVIQQNGPVRRKWLFGIF